MWPSAGRCPRCGRIRPLLLAGLAATSFLLLLPALLWGGRSRGRRPAGEAIEGGPAAAAARLVAGVPVHNYHRRVPAAAGPRRLGQDPVEDWVLNLQTGVSDAAVQALCDGGPGRCFARGRPSGSGVAFVGLRATERQLEVLLRNHSEKVLFAEPDGPLFSVPQPPSGGLGGGSSAPRRALPIAWGLDRIDMRHGLDGSYNPPGSGRGVHIYVADTGIRTTHRDFGGRAIPTLDTVGGMVFECSPYDRMCADDLNGHGTHCAGIAGGTNYGVAKAVTLHAVKTLNDHGNGRFSWFLAALDWVAHHGQRPAVLTASLGTSGRYVSVERAVEMASALGVFVVVAAGNSGKDACQYSPSYATSAFAVGATNADDRRETWSNYGPCLGIFAPGAHIMSDAGSSNRANGSMSGTSMACPFVAGASALLLQANPGTQPEQLAKVLQNRATRGIISNAGKGSPNLLLYTGRSGVAAAPPPLKPPPPPSPQREASCRAHRACSHLSGDCCPARGGARLECCSSVVAASLLEPAECSMRPRCATLGLAGECCPRSDGVTLACCLDIAANASDAAPH